MRAAQAGVERRKLFDKLFVLLGLVVLVAAFAVLFALFLDLLRQGAPRLDWDFLTSYASRKPEQAGILAAWVGTSLIMVVTACVAMPVGVAAAIYLERAGILVGDVIDRDEDLLQRILDDRRQRAVPAVLLAAEGEAPPLQPARRRERGVRAARPHPGRVEVGPVGGVQRHRGPCGGAGAASSVVG